jgi:hypothetical protein
MTKQQLIDALASKFTKVAVEAEWRTLKTIIGVDLVEILVWKLVGDTMFENNIIICKDGTDYYWKYGEPEKIGFAQRILTFIDGKITDGTVKFATLKEINQVNKKATIQAIMPDKTTKTVLLTETTEGVFTIDVIA